MQAADLLPQLLLDLPHCWRRGENQRRLKAASKPVRQGCGELGLTTVVTRAHSYPLMSSHRLHNRRLALPRLEAKLLSGEGNRITLIALEIRRSRGRFDPPPIQFGPHTLEQARVVDRWGGCGG